MKLYIAQSLDGFIADDQGGIEFLEEVPNPQQHDYGYHDFIAGIDVILMGRKSYEKILSFGIDWPYPECETVVLSSKQNLEINSPKTKVITDFDAQKIKELRSVSKKGIWLLGGGETIHSCLAQGAVKEIVLAIMPIILGSGIPLFPKGKVSSKWSLRSSEGFDSGVVLLRYDLARMGS